MAQRLAREALNAAIEGLVGWDVADDGTSIHKTFTFKDFIDAFAFMVKTALIAQSMDHHPDWRNVYNRVEITLTTHDLGGLSAKDMTLAAQIDKLQS